ncbi:MAG: S-layer homology domain-containing protein, partial [Clostridia bacterium]|nr:S-layer homology domain-containing protein [Clostridia bacterium]
RDQLMLMTLRFMDYMGIGFENSADVVEFGDADKIASWAAVDVEATRRAGLIKGDANGNFNPQASATRAEIATIVVRYTEKLPEAIDPMHVKLENILSLVETQSGKHIIFKFSSSSAVAANYYSDTSIRQQLFSQMGLNLNKYEVVISNDDMGVIRDVYSNLSIGGFSIKQVNMAIKNKLTGETTESVKLSFMMKKVESTYTETDPDNFDHGFDEKVYAEALNISLRSEGNIARLAAFFNKAEKGENVTVGYIGGSITEGASAQAGKSWAETTQSWIRKHVDPDAKYVNSGISGSSSALGLLRLDRDLISSECDLVFIEYAVNDNPGSDFHRSSFETLIRRLLDDDNTPAVVIVLCVTGSDAEDRYEHMESIADYYDLPVVDTRRAAHYIFKNTEMTYADFAFDDVHPQSFGHRMMGDMIINLLNTVKDHAKTASADELKIEKPTLAWVNDDVMYGMKLYNAAELLTAESTWKPMIMESVYGFDKGVTSSSSSDVLSFSFTGKYLTVAPFTAPMDIEVSVDGGAYFRVTCGHGYRVELQEVCKFDTVGTHSVNIRIPEQYNGTECTLLAFGIG